MMDLCSKNHEEVCYERVGRAFCPLCETLEKMDELREELKREQDECDKREDQIADLDKQLKQMEDLEKELHEALGRVVELEAELESEG